MLLAIDIGNTNTVFALFKGRDLAQFWRCRTEGARSVDEYAVFLQPLLEMTGISWSDIADVIVSSVVPDADLHIERFANKYFKRTPFFVTAENISGLKINLDRPGELGADRIVNALAVKAHYSTPAVVIDFGTATTFDVISRDGTYQGGVIAPGVRLSIEALHSRAAKLPRVGIKKPPAVIGKNTADAMKSGMYWGYIGLIEGIVAQIAAELGEKPCVIATGGLAMLYAESTGIIDHVDEYLTLNGLLRIYQNCHEK